MRDITELYRSKPVLIILTFTEGLNVTCYKVTWLELQQSLILVLKFLSGPDVIWYGSEACRLVETHSF